MRNLDTIINQLSAEQQRTEHLLLDDIQSVREATKLFFDRQQKEMDTFLGTISMYLDGIANRVKNGYPAENMPSIVSGRQLTEAERAQFDAAS